MPSSRTSSSSTPKTSRPERLLLDADTPPTLERLLRAIGFRTDSVLRIEEIDVRSDVAVLRYARKHRMIVVCFDMHKDNATKLAWNTEIMLRGGRAIQIDGGPAQPDDEAAGKVLMLYPAWSAVQGASPRSRDAHPRELELRHPRPASYTPTGGSQRTRARNASVTPKSKTATGNGPAGTRWSRPS